MKKSNKLVQRGFCLVGFCFIMLGGGRLFGCGGGGGGVITIVIIITEVIL